MKIHTTVTLDKELLEQTKLQKINLSATLNRLLRESLGPKKADPAEEKEVMKFVELCKQLHLTFEQAEQIKEFADRSIVGAWQAFKEKFNPDFDLYEYIEKRKAIRKLFNIQDMKINTK